MLEFCDFFQALTNGKASTPAGAGLGGLCLVPEIIRWLRRCFEKEQTRPVRWLNVAGPTKRQLSAELGDSECDRFLEATRTVINEVLRGLGNLAAEDEAPGSIPATLNRFGHVRIQWRRTGR